MQAPRDPNWIPIMQAASNGNDRSTVDLWADPSTHRLLVDIGSGGSGGTQYTQGGATVSNPTGTAIIYFDGSNNPKAVTTTQPLPANIAQIGGTSFSLGQQLASSSIPIVLTAAQITTLTPPSNTGYALDATLTGGTQQSKITDGTNVVGVLKADGTIASTQNALITAGGGMSTSTLTLNAGSPNTIWYDMLNYAWLSVSILTNTTPATLSFQTAGDSAQTNPVATGLLNSQQTNSGINTSTTSANATYYGPKTGRYFRISSNVAGGNTATLVITFYTNATQMQSLTVAASQNGTWTVGSNSAIASAPPANAFYLGGNDGSNLRGLTVNSTTYTSKFGLDGNLLGTLGTAFTTAGKVDVKAADGDVFVRQATGSNLHMVVDSGTITTVSAVTAITNALPAGTNVIGHALPDASTATVGTTPSYQSALSSTKTAIKASAGNLYGWHFYNSNNSVVYIQIFNKTTANVTVGSTAPDFVLVLPQGGFLDDPSLAYPYGFSNALTVAATTTPSGSTAPTNAINCTFFYI